MAQLPAKPTLADWQTFVKEMVAEKRFATDPNEVFVLFAEEVGELAKELRKRWTLGADGVRDTAPGELADVFMYLLDLANHFDADLEKAVRDKVAANANRKWKY